MQCRACGNTVPDSASRCDRCGHDLTEDAMDNAQMDKPRSRAKAIGIAIAIIVAIIVIAAIAFALIAPHQAPTSQPTADGGSSLSQSSSQSGQPVEGKVSEIGLPAAYGSYGDDRPASDDHGQFRRFELVQDDGGTGDGTAVLYIEWIPGKYDLGGNEVQLKTASIDAAVRVEVEETDDGLVFHPIETLSDGLEWGVSGIFTDEGVSLTEGTWTVEAENGEYVPVVFDGLSLKRLS